MFRLAQCLLRVPEIMYGIMLYGGGLVALISICAFIWGALRKKSKEYYFVWIGILIFSIIMIFLTTSGIILADTMFGG